MNPKAGAPQANAASASLSEFSEGLSLVDPNRWIIDSGATHHITSSPQSLTTIDLHSSMSPVCLPSGDKASITMSGAIQFTDSFSINNVLCVPSFKVDLLSVGKTIDGMSCSVTFFPSWCILQDLVTRTMIGVGKRRGDLYYLVALASIPPSNRFACNLTISSNLWHRRLGHPSSSRLQYLANNSLHFKFDSSHQCDVCPLAKQTRQPFPLSAISTTKIFSLIHCDIWGRYKTASHSGAHYFLTIVDDFSRFTWVFLMRHKSEAQTLLRQFFNYVATQFNTKDQQFRSDNGAEFLSLQKFFLEQGVIFQRSSVYTPQQNGVVERKHRHILETARALRFQSHLPISFWGECVLTAVYNINRLPTLLLNKKTPFEVLYRKLPDYSRMRVFGCIAFATSVNPSSKFDPRARKCIFIGYPMGQKAYKLYDVETKTIFTNRDVIFMEDTFLHSPQKAPSKLISEPSPPAQSIPITIVPDPFSFSSHPTPQLSNTTLPAPISSSTAEIAALSSPSPSSTPATAIDHTHLTPLSPENEPLPITSLNDIPAPNQLASIESIDVVPDIPDPIAQPLCHSQSSREPNVRLQDYVCSQAVEPSSYEIAASDPKWQQAMTSDLQALIDNNTWTLVPLPPGKRPIGCRWVYRIKYHADGSVERYKARLVAKGFTQTAGIDYHDTFSPTAKMVTVRCLLAIAACFGWSLHQLDVNNAFLNGDLLEEIYMFPPPGLRRQGESLVCRLNKSLYGLKQASRQWFSKFTTAIIRAGFTQSKADYSLFVRKDGGSFTALLIYVDDIMITGNCRKSINALKQFLHAQFRIKDLGELKYFLGIEIARSKKGIYLSQRKYALEIIKDSGYLGAKPVEFPMEECKLSNKGEPLRDPAAY
ncbi:hypothetical protein M0R45_031791 [Rubus argutus]|uniref:Integrase catalytic domain-containing protein n=1 Tax=Rubus argutus TaxID=59490 RepID=A0AAW1WIN3_RUBAR